MIASIKKFVEIWSFYLLQKNSKECNPRYFDGTIVKTNKDKKIFDLNIFFQLNADKNLKYQVNNLINKNVKITKITKFYHMCNQ